MGDEWRLLHVVKVDVSGSDAIGCDNEQRDRPYSKVTALSRHCQGDVTARSRQGRGKVTAV